MVFLLLFIFTIFSLFIVRSYLTAQRTDGAIIDAAGRNRMLSQQLGFYAERVVRGNEPVKDTLKSIIELHNASFYALKDGGIAPEIADNRLLPPTIPSILPIVRRAEEIWLEYKKNGEIIVNNPVFAEDALNFIEKNAPEMLQRNNEMVKAYVRMNNEKLAQMNLILFIILVTSIAVIGLGFRLSNSVAGKLEEKVKEEVTGRLAMTNVLGYLQVSKNQLEEEKAKDEAILASIGDAVMACDKKGQVVLFNGVAEALTGFFAKEVIGQHYSRSLRFIKESDGKSGEDFIGEAIKTGQKTNMTKHSLLITKDGRKIPVADSAAPIKNAQGNLVGCVVVFRDVTYEREVDKAKTEFVSLASHQLRTPLTSIGWYVEMLQAGDAGVLNDKQKEFLSEVYTGNRRMVELVNALLNVSRMELGTFVVEPEPTDVALLARSVVNEQKPQIDEKKIKFSLSFEKNIPLIQADPRLLRMVFQNLLSNAVRYTPKNGEIELSLSLDDKKNVLLKVSDTGYGIPKNQQNKIFTKLFRADNAREKDTEGTGLGLYIVKAIVDHDGGKIWFESEENKGTAFYVTLPLEGMKKKEGTKALS